VTFAAETPPGTAYGSLMPIGGKRLVGDTVILHKEVDKPEPPVRLVELVVNGRAMASERVPADGRAHELTFSVPIERSSWVALRQFPQLHTNPVNVLVEGQPIRVSRASALWCAAVIEQLWRSRREMIAEKEREEAHQTFLKAIDVYRKIAAEAPEGS
jgi:hypothetical protein